MVSEQIAEISSQEDFVSGYIGRIPVRNIWFLMLYASDLVRLKYFKKITSEKSPDDITDLIANILADEVERRLRRNLSFGYQPEEAWLRHVRGQIDILTTHRHQLVERGLVACRFEDLTVNTPRNRLVRAALSSISLRVSRIELSRRCRILANTLWKLGVHGGKPSRNEFSLNRYGRHDSGDQLMVAAARLAFDLALPTEAAGKIPVEQPDREESWIRRLYERAINGFYRVVLPSEEWAVDPVKSISWQIERGTSGIKDIFPGMEMDTVLDNRLTKRRIVIDTKFNSILTKGWHREKTLRSNYIYQIYAYLRSQEGKGDPLADSASGLFLHPAIDENVNETALIQGHAIKFATVDLTATIPEIRKQLLEVIKYPSEFFE